MRELNNKYQIRFSKMPDLSIGSEYHWKDLIRTADNHNCFTISCHDYFLIYKNDEDSLPEVIALPVGSKLNFIIAKNKVSIYA